MPIFPDEVIRILSVGATISVELVMNCRSLFDAIPIEPRTWEGVPFAQNPNELVE
jgi:hypothetical protein